MKAIETTKHPDYPYRLVVGVALRFDCTGLSLPRFEAFTLTGACVARSAEGILHIGHPYAWNGCTGFPKWMETEKTLEASCLHDLLYQLNQNNPSILSDRGAVDALFLSYCPAPYRPIFRVALNLFGGTAWNKKIKSLIIKST